MKVPIKKLIKSLYSENQNHHNNNGTKRLFWSMLMQAHGNVEVDINEIIEAYYDDDSNELIDLVQNYGSSNEINEFLKHTKGLISDKTYEMLDDVRKTKIQSEQNLVKTSKNQTL